jgi:hypothetical protein
MAALAALPVFALTKKRLSVNRQKGLSMNQPPGFRFRIIHRRDNGQRHDDLERTLSLV